MKSPLTGRPSRRITRRRAARGLFTSLAVAPLLVAAAACSSTSGTSVPAASGSAGSGSSASAGAPSSAAAASSGGAATFPVTVTAGNGPVTVATQPKAIVSLAPSLTEMLFAIGAGPQVKAVDEQSTFPAEAPRTKLSGFKPNAEAIAGYSPDLVVLSGDTGGLVAALTKLKVPVLLLEAPKTIDDSYTEELAIGRVTGHEAQAQQVVEATRKRIAAAVAAAPKEGGRKVYHELDPTYYSVTSATFIGDLYAKFGLTNIADSAPKAAGGYPQLSAEFVISAAPDLIVLADGKCCQQDAAAVAKRKAFASVPAVMGGRVLVVDDDIASRWGPRLGDFADQIAKTLGGAG